MGMHAVRHRKVVSETWSGAWRLLTPVNPERTDGVGHGRVLLGTLRDLVQTMDEAGVPDEAELVFRDERQNSVRGVVDIAIVYGQETDLLNGEPAPIDIAEEVSDAADEG